MITARKVTPDEMRRGYSVCECGKYAHVFSGRVIARLPKDYSGELCKECSCWMVRVDLLKEEK